MGGGWLVCVFFAIAAHFENKKKTSLNKKEIKHLLCSSEIAESCFFLGCIKSQFHSQRFSVMEVDMDWL